MLTLSVCFSNTKAVNANIENSKTVVSKKINGSERQKMSNLDTPSDDILAPNADNRVDDRYLLCPFLHAFDNVVEALSRTLRRTWTTTPNVLLRKRPSLKSECLFCV